MENTKLVTYEGAGKRIIMTATKRAELAKQQAADALLFDEEVGADIAQESVAWTVAIFGGFGVSLLFCITLLINMLMNGGF